MIRFEFQVLPDKILEEEVKCVREALDRERRREKVSFPLFFSFLPSTAQ